jgi:hypothetical protein
MAKLIDSYLGCQTDVGGKWYIARPLRLDGIGGFILKLKDAWLVITDKADAVIFKKSKPNG